MTAGLACAVVLFDLDGVLVSSGASVRRSWTAWAGAHGIDPVDVLAASSGTRSVDTIRQVAPELDAVAEAARLEAEQALDVDDVVACQGAQDLLRTFGDDEWAVVTSGTTPLAKARLRAAGLPEPRVLVTAELVSAGKPDPAGYLLAARLLAQSPDDCLVIEDAAAGVQAARRAGMRVIGLSNGDGSTQLAGADLVTESCAGVHVRRFSQGFVVGTR